MPQRPFAKPLFIQKNKIRPLERIAFDDDFRDEDWLQGLLYDHPEILPFEELDPLFRDSVPLAREVESGSGPIDIVYANADGLVTLVETKLWRNPGSRREVVAQLINYAAKIGKMSYEEFSRVIADAEGSDISCLVKKVSAATNGFDGARFHDALTRNLRRGRFLLLIVGDGIREDVEGMGEFLQGHPEMSFTLRLVEMSIYRMNSLSNDEVVILPQIIAKTSEVVRAVVEVRGNQIMVATPAEPKTVLSDGHFKTTPEQFFAALAEEVTPQTVVATRAVIDSAEKHGLTVQWMQGGPVLKYVDEPTGHFFTLGQLHREGDLRELFRLPVRCKQLHLPDRIWTDYFDAIARLVPGASRTHGKFSSGKEWDSVDDAEGIYCSLQTVLQRQTDWFSAIDATIAAISMGLEKATKDGHPV